MAIEIEIKFLCQFPLEEIVVSAGPRLVGVTSPPSCAPKCERCKDSERQMEFKAVESRWLCFVYKSESSST